jgi:hypothetical protein
VLVIGIEPALECPRGNVKVFGNMRMTPPPGCHEDRLTPVAQASISRRGKGGFQLLVFMVA